MATVVLHRALIMFGHRVFIGAGRNFLFGRLFILMHKVSAKLCNPEVPQLSIPEEIVLHFIQVEIDIRVLWNIHFVLWFSFDPVVCIDCELWPYILSGNCTSDHMEPEQPVVAHA